MNKGKERIILWKRGKMIETLEERKPGQIIITDRREMSKKAGKENERSKNGIIMNREEEEFSRDT